MHWRKTIGLGVEPCGKSVLKGHSTTFFLCGTTRINLLLKREEIIRKTWPKLS